METCDRIRKVATTGATKSTRVVSGVEPEMQHYCWLDQLTQEGNKAHRNRENARLSASFENAAKFILYDDQCCTLVQILFVTRPDPLT